MARKRMIDPDFWSDQAVGELSLCGRLLFMGLISQADDEGRLRGNPALIRSQLFPYDETIIAATVDTEMSDLERVRLIVRYEADGQQFVWIRNFRKHQTINKPTPSRLPPPPDMTAPEPAIEPVPSLEQVLPDGSRSSPVALPPKRREEKRSKENRTEGNGSAPYALVVTFCEEFGKDERDAPQKWIDEQCKHAAGLIADGCTDDQFRRLCRYVRSQTWRTTAVSVKTIRGAYGDWVMDKEPAEELKHTERENIRRNNPASTKPLEQKHGWLFDNGKAAS